MLTKLVGSTLGQVALVGVVALILVLGIKSCTSGWEKAEQAKQDQRGAEALSETAKDAAATVINRADEDASIEDLVKQTQEEIENATDVQVSRRHALDAICSMPNHPKPSGC